jgi:hypothetical protein
LQLRKTNRELREAGDATRGLIGQEGADDDSLSNTPRNLMPPMLTFLDREAELKNDDDLIPEFKPFAAAPGFTDRLVGNPEVY